MFCCLLRTCTCWFGFANRKINCSIKKIHQKYFKKNSHTTQKMKFSIKYFFSKCDQILRKLRIGSHLLKKYLMENFIFCAVSQPWTYIRRLEDIQDILCKFNINPVFSEKKLLPWRSFIRRRTSLLILSSVKQKDCLF